MKKIVYSADGKHIVGVIEGTTFRKTIKLSQWVRKYDALSVEEATISGPVLEVCGLAGLIEIKIKETGCLYRSTVKNFLRFAITDNLGSGVHYFLKREHWTILPPKQQRMEMETL